MSSLMNWRFWLYGFLTWLVPFVASFLFFDPSKGFVIPQPLFKSLMVVIGGTVGAGLLVLALRKVQPSVAVGFAIGLLFLEQVPRNASRGTCSRIFSCRAFFPKTGFHFSECAPAINLEIDFAILVPMMKTSITDYFYDIGLRYLLLPTIAVAIGVVTRRAL